MRRHLGIYWNLIYFLGEVGRVFNNNHLFHSQKSYTNLKYIQTHSNTHTIYIYIRYAEAALQRCSHERPPLPPPKKKNAENSQENTHTEMRPQQSSHAALLKSHSNVGIPPQIYHINPPKHPPTRAPPKDCVHIYSKIQINLKQWFLRNFKITLPPFLCQVVSI